MRKNQYILLFVSLIFVLLIFVLLQLGKFVFGENYIPSDSYEYINASNILYKEFIPHPTRPLGYAFILGLPNLFIDSVSLKGYLIFSVILNLFFWFGTIILLYKSLHLFIGKRSSFFATLFFIICIGNVTQIFYVLTETVVTFLLLLMSYFLLIHIKNKNTKYLILGVSVLNIIILFKPGMFYFAGFISLSLMLYLFYIRKIKKLKSFYFILSVLLVAIQFSSIYKTYGNITPSYIGKLAWYHYLGAKSNAKANNISYSKESDIRLSTFKDLNWNDKSRVSVIDFKNQITGNFNNVLIVYAKNIFGNISIGSGAIPLYDNEKNNISNLRFNRILWQISRYQNILFVFLFLMSLVLIFYYRRKVNAFILISSGVVLYTILTSGISFLQGDRFHIVFYPLVIINILYLLSWNSKVMQILKR